MEYMIFIGTEESRGMLSPTDPGFDEYMSTWMAYNQKLIDGGHLIGGSQLQPTSTATTIRRADGSDTVVRNEGAARRLLPDQRERPRPSARAGRSDAPDRRRDRGSTGDPPTGFVVTAPT
jgi:hypothetical protein